MELNNKVVEVVNNYKYLGFWFTTGNSYNKHIRSMVAKTRIATNAAWDVMRRARVDGLKARSYLLNTLSKTILTYGVELWGWRERQEIEREGSRLVKMAMGLNANTPTYIWRAESGNTELEVETRRRASLYLIRIMEMEEERLPKVCLKEDRSN